MTLTPRVHAVLTLSASLANALGALYIAFDVFGRHAGLLGVLTRAATYSAALSVIFGLALGPAFAAVGGLGMGSLIALEYWLLARRQRLQLSSPLTQPWWSGAGRGAVLGLAAMPRFGVRFGSILFLIEVVVLASIYGAGLVPTFHPTPGRPTLSRPALQGAIMRAVAIGVAAAGAAALVWGPAQALRLGAEFAGLTALAGFFFIVVVPYAELRIEHASDQFFIAVGLALIFCGLALAAVPSLLVLLSGGP